MIHGDSAMGKSARSRCVDERNDLSTVVPEHPVSENNHSADSRPENLASLADLPGQWIDKVQQLEPPRIIVLDMDSSESPTYGEQEGSAYNGHFGCTCYHPLFVFNQFGDVERCARCPASARIARYRRAG